MLFKDDGIWCVCYDACPSPSSDPFPSPPFSSILLSPPLLSNFLLPVMSWVRSIGVTYNSVSLYGDGSSVIDCNGHLNGVKQVMIEVHNAVKSRTEHCISTSCLISQPMIMKVFTMISLHSRYSFTLDGVNDLRLPSHPGADRCARLITPYCCTSSFTACG